MSMLELRSSKESINIQRLFIEMQDFVGSAIGFESLHASLIRNCIDVCGGRRETGAQDS